MTTESSYATKLSSWQSVVASLTLPRLVSFAAFAWLDDWLTSLLLMRWGRLLQSDVMQSNAALYRWSYCCQRDAVVANRRSSAGALSVGSLADRRLALAGGKAGKLLCIRALVASITNTRVADAIATDTVAMSCRVVASPLAVSYVLNVLPNKIIYKKFQIWQIISFECSETLSHAVQALLLIRVIVTLNARCHSF